METCKIYIVNFHTDYTSSALEELAYGYTKISRTNSKKFCFRSIFCEVLFRVWFMVLFKAMDIPDYTRIMANIKI